MTVPPNDGIYPRIPDDVYHGDHDSLSSSGARTLLNLTPAEFDEQRQQPPKPKPQYDFGHAAHKMVLGEGAQIAVLDPKKHGLTKDGEVSAKPAATAMWKEAEAKARGEGKSCITKEQMQTAQRMAGNVFAHPLAARLLANGSAELSCYWHDQATSMRLRSRPDFLPEVGNGRPIILDYKTATSASPAHFAKQAADFGYHNQAAWYIDGLAAAAGVEGAAFLFIVQQKTAPYLVSICQLLPDHVELGRQQNRRAIDLYAQCVESKTWPGYDTGIHNVELPAWYVKQLESQLELAA